MKVILELNFQMNSEDTKFKYNDQVIITHGFYRSLIGTIEHRMYRKNWFSPPTIKYSIKNNENINYLYINEEDLELMK